MNNFLNLKGKTWQGTIIKKASPKTAAVSVTRIVEHKLYRLRYKRSKTFQSHDPIGASVGDQVIIQECPPVSKLKCTVITTILRRAA